MKKHYSSDVVREFEDVDGTRKLKLSKFSTFSGKNVVLSRFCGVPPAKRSKLARKTLNAEARGEVPAVGNFSIVNRFDKMQLKGRPLKYPEMSRRITDYIMLGWHSGSPVSRQSCYIKCREWSKKGDAFYNQYLNYNKTSSGQQLSH